MMNALDAERITALCRSRAKQVTVRVVDETGSTNADLMAALPELVGPVLLIARRQTAGRGRAGRSWLSEPGKSLTFSLAWKFALPVHSLVGLPLAVGVALAETLAATGVEARLKWPNDILLEGKKLAGILIESATAAPASSNARWAVIGVGMNTDIGEATIAEIGRPVANLPLLAGVEQDVLLASLLNGLADALVQFEHEGFGAFSQRWNALHAYSGRPVMILDRGQVQQEGIAAGVDGIGRFLLDTQGGRVAVMAGDVSLRPKE